MGAYWLLRALRRAAPKRSRWRGATLETVRRTFVKIAVRVERVSLMSPLAIRSCLAPATPTSARGTNSAVRRRRRRAWRNPEASGDAASPCVPLISPGYVRKSLSPKLPTSYAP